MSYASIHRKINNINSSSTHPHAMMDMYGNNGSNRSNNLILSKAYEHKLYPQDTHNNNSINHMMNNSYTYNYNPQYRVTRLPNPPSYLQHGSLQFVIMDAPTDDNLLTYIKELSQKAVKCVVRTCEPTYSEEPIIEAKMQVIDVAFPDGHPPSDDIVNQWLEIVNLENCRLHRPVAVHCVAGLGRAPVLVAIALIEIADIDPLKAIQLIRKARRGAINQKQYQYLKHYVRKSKHDCLNGACTIL